MSEEKTWDETYSFAVKRCCDSNAPPKAINAVNEANKNNFLKIRAKGSSTHFDEDNSWHSGMGAFFALYETGSLAIHVSQWIDFTKSGNFLGWSPLYVQTYMALALKDVIGDDYSLQTLKRLPKGHLFLLQGNCRLLK